jgi:hypothetical protein
MYQYLQTIKANHSYKWFLNYIIAWGRHEQLDTVCSWKQTVCVLFRERRLAPRQMALKVDNNALQIAR